MLPTQVGQQQKCVFPRHSRPLNDEAPPVGFAGCQQAPKTESAGPFLFARASVPSRPPSCADVIVTRGADLLALREHAGIAVVTLRAFLGLFRD